MSKTEYYRPDVLPVILLSVLALKLQIPLILTRQKHVAV